MDDLDLQPSETHLPLTERRAYKESIKLLARQDYSRAKLRQKLRQRGIEAGEIEEVLGLLIERRYLREENYIEARAKGLITKGLSPASIQQKLQSEGLEVPQDQIEQFMAEKGTDSSSQLRSLIIKKTRHKSREAFLGYAPEARKERDKVLRFLLSKGYSFTDSKKALDQHLSLPSEAEDSI